MSTPRAVNRRQFLLGTAGALAVAVAPSPLLLRHAGAQAVFPVGSTARTTARLNLRSGPGLNHRVIVVLWKDAPVTITGAPVSADGFTWYPVRTGYGTEGYVAGEFLRAPGSPPAEFPVGSTARTTARVNLRQGPSLSYRVIVVLWDGAPVTITGAPVAGDGFTWYPVRTNYGTEGWLAGEFLTA